MDKESNELKNLEAIYLSRVAKDLGILSGEGEGEGVTLETTYVEPKATQIKQDKFEESKGNFQSKFSNEKTISGKTLTSDYLPRGLGEILLENKYLVLLGEPGSGKSTTLQYLAWCFANEEVTLEKLDLIESRVPILLSPKDNYWREIEGQDVEVALEKIVSRYIRTEEKRIPDLV